LVSFIQNQRGLAQVKGVKLIVRRDWSETEDRLRGAFAIARDLARLARPDKAAA